MTVMADDGKQYICRARGKFRLDGRFPLAGDLVTFRRAEGDEHLIESILDRKNYLIRPPVANVSRLCVIASMAPPVTDRLALDTLIAAAEYNGITPAVVVNKIDAVPGEALAAVYRRAGYDVFLTSTKTGEGIEEFRKSVGEGITVFAGSSGVGKSSLLNLALPEFHVKTSRISERIGRGRHTTRHVELFSDKKGGYVVDTPGFSHVDPVQMMLYDKKRIASCFAEFRPYLQGCRYDDCAHTREEDCAVIRAVEEGAIDRVRHENYVSIYEKVAKLKDWQIRELLASETI
jgi:ribosome biogenesis GTPase